jgi:NAD(P)-dependent dehydrogenase (short-subunit alcohol dehydrogenase family)
MNTLDGHAGKRFRDKVAFVTGGASGIGAMAARRLAQEGAAVVVADLQADLGRDLAKEIGDAYFQPLDITDEGAWQASMQTLQQKFGRLDVMVNSAGMGGWGSIEETSSATWHKVMNVNAFGTFLACRFAVEAMRRSGGGSIINVGSALSMRADPSRISYCASKAAVVHLTRCVALHCGKQGYGIRCNAIMPGVIDTPLLSNLRQTLGSEEAIQAKMSEFHPLGRMGRSEEVAALIAFLASDESSFITAACYAVDGGMIERF